MGWGRKVCVHWGGGSLGTDSKRHVQDGAMEIRNPGIIQTEVITGKWTIESIKAFGHF